MSGYVRLTLGRDKYLIPQHEVVAFEPVVDIDKAEADDNSIGVISYENVHLPVYHFTSDLRLSGTTDESRRICICLRHEDIQFGMLCDEVDNVMESDFSMFNLPECMKTETCPVIKLAVSGNKVLNVIDTKSLAKLLPDNGLLEDALLDDLTTGQ